MDRKKVVVYFVVPMGTIGVLLAMYFSGVRLFESIVAMPYLDRVTSNSRREFGLLENLQNLTLLAIIFISVRAAIRSRDLFVRSFFGVIAAGTLFVLLEEIDYGLHFYEILAGVPPDNAAEARNFHNVGNRNRRFKQASDVFMVLFFVLAPFLLRRVNTPRIRFLVPDPYLALTMLVALVTHTIAHSLDDRGYGFGLKLNISEFRELITYYLAFLYTLELSRRDRQRSTVQGASIPT